MGSKIPGAIGRARRRAGSAARVLVILVVLGGLLVLLVLRFGGEWLVVHDPLPSHAEVAVMLDGSAPEVRVRRPAAVGLLAAGRVDHVLISLPETSAWGESVPQMARQYVEKTYPPALGARISFCLLGPTINSTAEEALVLEGCLQQRGWRSVIVVTSDFHSRRARMIWRQTLEGAEPPFTLAVDPVPNSEFTPRRWWARRFSAKTWLRETVKILWIAVVGIHHWP